MVAAFASVQLAAFTGIRSKGKINFSLNGEVYSLTKGLLMGDPFSFPSLLLAFD
jgi:hypothetical protein